MEMSEKLDFVVFDASPFECGQDEESNQALQKTRICFRAEYYFDRQGVSCPASEDIISKWIAGSWPVDRNELSTVSPSDDQEMYYGPMRLYYDSQGVLHLEIDKVGNNLSEVSPSDGQETKNFNPVLFEGSPSGSQEKKLDSVLPFEGGQESSITDGKESKKFSTNLSEVSPFDRQETKDFNPNLLESLSAAEPTDSSSVPVDDREAKKLDMIRLLYESSTIITEAIWDDDDDDNLVDEELLKEYLEKLDAKDRTRKIVKVDVDLCLREVKSYHSLTPSKKLDWITLQVMHRCYDSFCTNWTSQPLPLSEESSLPDWKIEELDDGKSDYEDSDEDYENSDEYVSHHEDCILDLNYLFPEDSDQDDSDHEDSELKKVESEEDAAQFKIMESQKAAQLESWKKVDQIKLMEFSKKGEGSS